MNKRRLFLNLVTFRNDLLVGTTPTGVLITDIVMFQLILSQNLYVKKVCNFSRNAADIFEPNDFGNCGIFKFNTS